MHLNEQNELLDTLEKYDFSALNNDYASKTGKDIDEVKSYEKELKRFLFLIKLNRTQYGISGILDEYWHLAIIHTKFYHDLCEFVFGHYLHHQPEENGSPDAIDMRYIRLLVDYHSHFKEAPPFAVWPLSQEMFAPSPVFAKGPQCMAPCFWAV